MQHNVYYTSRGYRCGNYSALIFVESKALKQAHSRLRNCDRAKYIYPVYNLFYYHEGHEDAKGKRQSDLSNKVITCAIVVIKHSVLDCWNPRGTVLTYMKLANIKQGFLINFNAKLLKQELRAQQYLQVLHALHGEINNIFLESAPVNIALVIASARGKR